MTSRRGVPVLAVLFLGVASLVAQPAAAEDGGPSTLRVLAPDGGAPVPMRIDDLAPGYGIDSVYEVQLDAADTVGPADLALLVTDVHDGVAACGPLERACGSAGSVGLADVLELTVRVGELHDGETCGGFTDLRDLAWGPAPLAAAAAAHSLSIPVPFPPAARCVGVEIAMPRDAGNELQGTRTTFELGFLASAALPAGSDADETVGLGGPSAPTTEVLGLVVLADDRPELRGDADVAAETTGTRVLGAVLARTGLDAATLLLLAGVLLAVGLRLVLHRRRTGDA